MTYSSKNTVTSIVLLLLFSFLSCKREGCTDKAARNYEAKAKRDDGSCVYPGCTDQDALNFSALANMDDGTCKYTGAAVFYLSGSCGDVEVYVGGSLKGILTDSYVAGVDCNAPPAGTVAIDLQQGLYNYVAMPLSDTIDTTWSGQISIMEKQCLPVAIRYP